MFYNTRSDEVIPRQITQVRQDQGDLPWKQLSFENMIEKSKIKILLSSVSDIDTSKSEA